MASLLMGQILAVFGQTSRFPVVAPFLTQITFSIFIFDYWLN
jgi:hypothetical protein